MIIQKIPTKLDIETSTAVQQNIIDLLDQGQSVALDFSSCKYISSVGLRVVLYSFKYAVSKNLSVFLVGVDDYVHQVMRLTGFEKYFKFYDTIEECIANQ